MNKLLAIFIATALSTTVDAASTINATNKYAWGANIGWTNWLPSPADGVVIGEFVCSGYIWGANVGWINMGSGAPTNNIQYSQGAGDTGVNYGIDPAQPGVATLRGFAYGANIGWINFEVTGNHYLTTDHIAMGIDTDGDGIADAFEFLFTNPDSLATMNGTTDTDGDGISDKDEYLDGTSPLIPNDRLRITVFGTNSAGTSSPITWTSTTARLYIIETKADLLAAMWDPDPTFGAAFAPDAGTSSMRIIPAATATKRFYRIKSVRPLP